MENLAISVSHQKREQIFLLIVLLLLALPFVLYFYTAFQYSPNIPVGDDWDAILSFMKHFLKSETFIAKLQLLFKQHNEHKVVFDRLVFLGQYYLTGEINFKHLYMFGALGWALTVFVLMVTMQKKYHLPLISLLPIPYILFTMVHQTFQFSSMGSIHHYWVICFAILFLYTLTEDKYTYAVFFYLLALYTSGHGLLLYPLGNLLLLLKKRLKPFFLFFIASSLLTLSYLYNYHHPSHHPSVLGAMVNFQKSIAFFFTFLGNMFSVKLALWIGCINFLGLITFAVIRYRDRYLFSIVGLIVVIAGALSLSRSGFGVQQALKSGYAMYSLLAWVCIYLFLIRSVKNKTFATGIILTTLVLSVLFFFSVLTNNNTDFLRQKMQRMSGIAVSIHGEKDGLTYPKPKKRYFAMRKALLTAKKYNIYDYEKGIPHKIPQELSINGIRQKDSLVGAIDSSNSLSIRGWALFPDLHAAKASISILLSDDKHILKLDTIKLRRPDVSKAYNKGNLYDESGYEAYPSLYQIPPGTYKIGILVTNRGTQEIMWSNKVYTRLDSDLVIDNNIATLTGSWDSTCNSSG